MNESNSKLKDQIEFTFSELANLRMLNVAQYKEIESYSTSLTIFDRAS